MAFILQVDTLALKPSLYVRRKNGYAHIYDRLRKQSIKQKRLFKPFQHNKTLCPLKTI